MARRSIEWQAYEYYFREKTRDWYWIVWIVTFAIAAISVMFGNALFAALIVVGIFALTIFAKRPPSLLHYEINERGIIVEKTFYPYSALHSFGIDTHSPEMPKLVIKLKRSFLPYLIILIAGVDEEDIRDFLAGYLPDAGHSEPLSHKIMEYLGF